MLPKHSTAASDDEPIGILIAAARSAINQLARARLDGAGLTPQQFWVLMALYEHPGTSLRELCQQRRMDPPTGSRIVSALSAKKLVHIGGDVADRRRCRLELTAEGHAFARGKKGLLRELRQLVAGDLTPAEQQTLRWLLRRVIRNVSPGDAAATEASLAGHPHSLEP